MSLTHMLKFQTILICLLIVNCSSSRHISAKSFEVEGLYYGWGGMSIFRPCDMQKIYWLDGNSFSINSLQDYSHKNAGDTLQKPVYVRFTAVNIGYQYDGEADNFDETLYMQTILDIKDFSKVVCRQVPLRDY